MRVGHLGTLTKGKKSREGTVSMLRHGRHGMVAMCATVGVLCGPLSFLVAHHIFKVANAVVRSGRYRVASPR